MSLLENKAIVSLLGDSRLTQSVELYRGEVDAYGVVKGDAITVKAYISYKEGEDYVDYDTITVISKSVFKSEDRLDYKGKRYKFISSMGFYTNEFKRDD